MRYDELAALSPVVRKEVLTGELQRRIKALEIVPANEVDSIVDSLVSLSLSEIVTVIQDNAKLTEQVTNAKKGSGTSPGKSPSPSASQDSRLLDPAALNATASAPEHPSTPISATASLSTPPRTSSPSGSVPPTSERDRMVAAVGKLETSRQSELTDLIMSLPKRERAMCLFNTEVLRAKIADAKMVLDSDDAEEQKTSAPSVPAAPATPQGKRTAQLSDDSPRTPDLSSRGASAAASPTPSTPASTTYTVASLARLPAAEIVRLASSSSSTGLPLPKADPLVVKATDDFIDGLLDKPIQQQKQQLGDKLFVELLSSVPVDHLFLTWNNCILQVACYQGLRHKRSSASMLHN